MFFFCWLGKFKKKITFTIIVILIIEEGIAGFVNWSIFLNIFLHSYVVLQYRFTYFHLFEHLRKVLFYNSDNLKKYCDN